MLSRAVRPVLTQGSRRTFWTRYNGGFNTYPAKKVYWGKGNFSGETLIAAGFVSFIYFFHRLVEADFLYNSYCMASNHFNMDNLIIVDGKYRYIPPRMMPPAHKGGGYGYQEMEQDWTPTDGKGI